MPGESEFADQVAGPIYVLGKSEFAAVLDTTSNPIHWLNERVCNERREKSGGRVIRNEAEAVEYTIFFGANVCGDDGPFHVLSSGKDEHLAGLSYAESGFPSEYDFLETLDAIKYPSAVSIPSKEGTNTGQVKYEVDAWVLYGKVIFKVKFQLEANGNIEMTEDNPSIDYLVDGPKTLMAWEVKTLESKAKLVASDHDTTLDRERKAESEPEAPLDTDGKLDNKIIVGQLSAETLAVRTFSRCRFRGRLNLRHLASPRLGFEKCVFDNGVDLSGANVDGSISFIDCKVREGKHYRGVDSAESFSLEGIGARQLSIHELESDCSLAAKSMRVSGAVKIEDIRILGAFDLENLAAQSISCYRAKASKGLNLPGCVAEDFMVFHDVQTTDKKAGIDLYGSVVTNNYVDFRNVSLEGDLCATFLRVGTGFFLEGAHTDAHTPSRISGSVDLSGAKLPKKLRIQNTNVGDSIAAAGIVAGALDILGPNLRTKRGDWAAETCSVGDRIDLTDAVIDHDVTIVDVCAGEKVLRKSENGTTSQNHDPNPSLVLRNAKVNGNVNLFLSGTTAKKMRLLDQPDDDDRNDNGQSVRVAADENYSDVFELDPRTIDFSSKWIGGIDLSDCSVGGDIDLTSIKCPHGDIKLTDTRIERNLRLRRNSNVTDDGRCEANSLIMTSVECKGTTDITGLSLTQSRDNAAKVIANLSTFGKQLKVSVRNYDIDGARKNVDDVIMQLSTWRKRLRVAVDYDGDSAMKGVANLIANLTSLKSELVKLAYGDDQGIESAAYDCLDLSGTTIGDLTISVNEQNSRAVSEEYNPKTRGSGKPEIILEYAHVNRLRAILRQSADEGKLYPHPIDLRFAEIKWWDFDPPSSEEGKAGQDYVLLLRKNSNVQRHTFRSIEQNLFNQGQEDAADEVHKEMRSQVLKNSSAWTRILWGPLDWLTFSNTSPKRLIAWVAVWFLSSILVFSIRGNIAPSPEGLAARRAQGLATPYAGPSADQWGWKPAFWLALRYHVPVAAFTAEHDWQPRNDTILTLPKLWRTKPLSAPPSSSFATGFDRFFTAIGLKAAAVDAPKISSVTAEDYANVVLAFHWILLPVILILTSRKLFRRVEK